MFIRNLMLSALLLTVADSAYSADPEAEEKPTTFSIDAEFRLRSEIRYGYRNPATADSKVAAFIGQRSRLNLKFGSRFVDARLSLQDVRTWGEIGPGDRKGTFMLHEAWVDIPLGKTKAGFRLGRQELGYDNERLISPANWSMTGRSHDAVKLWYKHNNTELQIVAGYNQPGEILSGRDFFAPNNYKVLNVVWFKQKAGDKFTFSLLNIGDGYQADTTVIALKESRKLFYRFTHFGRVEFDNGRSWYFTTAGAIQYGKNNKDQQILSWYVQPEVKYTGVKQLTLRVGAEILSGQDAAQPFEKVNSFSTLYGVGHKFNGFLDYFTSFPADVNGGGLINPYLLANYKINDKLTLAAQFHAFTHANNYVVAAEMLNKYLGFETDLIFGYQPNKVVGLEVGYSIYKGSATSVAVKGGEENRPGQWGYIQVYVRPEFFRYVK